MIPEKQDFSRKLFIQKLFHNRLFKTCCTFLQDTTSNTVSENELAWESTADRMISFEAKASPAYITLISEVSFLNYFHFELAKISWYAFDFFNKL